MKPLRSYTLFVAASACISGLLFGYYMAVISGALLFLSPEFHFSLGEETIFVSIILLGAIIGSIAGGYLTEYLGRKKVFWLTCLLISAGTIFLLFPASYSFLLLARVIQGTGIGLISVVAPLYLGEIAPTSHRGSIVSSYQLMMTLGALIAYVINCLFAPTGNWQMMFLLGLVPALLQALLLFFMPESPSWLFRKGQASLAAQVCLQLEIQTPKEVPKEIEKPIRRKTLVWILWIGAMLSVFQQVTGINTIIYYAPRIFQEAGYTSALSAVFATVSLGASNFLGCLLSVWLLDRVGRKKLLLLGIFGMIVGLFCLSIFSFYNVPFIDKISVVSLFVYVFSFAIGLGPVTWVLIAEIYPAQIREKAIAFAVFSNWLCVYIILATFPYLFSWIKIPGTFGLYGGMCILAFFFIWRFLPETKQKSSEEIMEMFDKKNRGTLP
ncbi:MAG: sugar porter family MFS transporter [Rhabdochlamydiaceae bacterium]|nr:sugar porter family MFS transporter [Rhabdochlamydiaceae bacterium]